MSSVYAMSELNVLIVDDNILKGVEIKRALEFNGIRDIKSDFKELLQRL